MTTLFLLACILIYACTALLNKQSVGAGSLYSVQIVTSIVSIFLLPIWIFLAKKFNTDGVLVSWETIKYAAPAALLAGFSSLLYLSVMKVQSATITTALLSTYPIAVMIIGVAIGLEAFSWSKVLGILLICGGIFCLR